MPEFEAGVDDVERDAAEEEVGRAERRQVHLLEVRVPHAVGAQLLWETLQLIQSLSAIVSSTL